jgi:hypothetical protein
VEQEIEQLEARQAELEALLADPAGLAGGLTALPQLSAEHAAVQARQSELLLRWEALAEKNQG